MGRPATNDRGSIVGGFGRFMAGVVCGLTAGWLVLAAAETVRALDCCDHPEAGR